MVTIRDVAIYLDRVGGHTSVEDGHFAFIVEPEVLPLVLGKLWSGSVFLVFVVRIHFDEFPNS